MLRMFRNREVQAALGLIVVISAAGTLGAASISSASAGVAAAVSVLLVSVFIVYTAWRYREVDKLSQYLRRVVQGDHTLDIRDNAEGELSILKNEIYKVTVMLSEQASALRREKGNLADALSDISHQLKTPLTSMFVLTDLLCEDLPEERRQEFTDKLRNQLERLQWLVTSLLKLSKLEAGTIEFRRRQVEAGRIVREACEPLMIPMELKGHSLVIHCPECRFSCDPNWTVEALVNIIKNCVEHTPAGGEIKISCQDNPLYLEISVEDSGSGIDKEDLPYIFNRFYKGKNAGDDSVGIGLAMAKGIISAQGGTIDVRSSREGAKFFLRFHK